MLLLRAQSTRDPCSHTLASASDASILDAPSIPMGHPNLITDRSAGKSAGERVVMRYGELLAADGKTLNPMTSVAGQIKGPTENTCALYPYLLLSMLDAPSISMGHSS